MAISISFGQKHWMSVDTRVKRSPHLGQSGGTKPKKSSEGIQAMTSAFTNMANTVASAFNTGPEKKGATTCTCSVYSYKGCYYLL